MHRRHVAATTSICSQMFPDVSHLAAQTFKGLSKKNSADFKVTADLFIKILEWGWYWDSALTPPCLSLGLDALHDAKISLHHVFTGWFGLIFLRPAGSGCICRMELLCRARSISATLVENLCWKASRCHTRRQVARLQDHTHWQAIDAP